MTTVVELSKPSQGEAPLGIEYEDRPECHIQIYDTPPDLPKEIIGYNPGGLQKVRFEIADKVVEKWVLPVRVESDRNDSGESHLGKTVSRFYYINEENELSPVWTLYRQDGMTPEEEAELQLRYDVLGEDPSFKLMPMKQPDGSIKEQWMLSTVVVEAQTVTEKTKNGEEVTHTGVKSFVTKFYFADSLEDLNDAKKRKELTGPERMKDVRICPIRSWDSDGKPILRYMVYGRPEGEMKDASGKVIYKGTGKITFAIVDSLDEIETPEVQQQLINNFLKADLYPDKHWGGVGDALQLDETHMLILAHDAKKTGENDEGRYYTPVLYIHDFTDPDNPKLTEFGAIAPPESFPSDEREYAAKADQFIDMRTVVFPGGFSIFVDDDGRIILEMTAGYRDSRIANVIVRLSQQQSDIINSFYNPSLQEQFELAV